MPSALTYPGVYLEELPSGSHTIAGVSTSVTAFIGRCLKGPVDESIVINSFADFERTFGGLWLQSNLGFAVRDFYLNGGSQAVIVRVHRNHSAKIILNDNAGNPVIILESVQEGEIGNALQAEITSVSGHLNQFNLVLSNNVTGITETYNNLAMAAEEGATLFDQDVLNNSQLLKVAADGIVTTSTVPKNGITKVIDKASFILKDSANNPAITLEAVVKGDIGNLLKIEVIDVPSKPNQFNLTLTNTQTGKVEFYNNFAMAAEAGATLFDQNALNNSQLFKVAANGIAATPSRPASGPYYVTIKPNYVVEAAQITLKAGTELLELKAVSPGQWANGLKVKINHNVSAEVAANFDLPVADLFNLIIVDNLTGYQESFLNLTVKDSPQRIDKVLEEKSNVLNVLGDLPAARPDEFNDIEVSTIKSSVSEIADDGLSLQAKNIIGNAANKTGLYALLKADIVNLLCIPPYNAPSASDNVSVINTAIAFCEKQRIFYIIDAPDSWNNKDQAKSGIADVSVVGNTSPNAAIFFPQIKTFNPLRNNQLDEFAPCGVVAGIMARIDAERGIWKAPAGIEAGLAGVADLTVHLNDAENGELNPLGLNCLRTMPAAGPVIWGARTRKGNDQLASEWKYIPVRRLALYIEESLYRGMQWAVFEPNDAPLWRQIALNVDGFMNRLFRQGAFQGSTAKDAYFVKCDKDTTTQDDIDRGIVNVLVGFAPLKPAEFVVIKLQQIAGQTA